jgi:parallel beta-helix repeat protein
VETEEDSIVYVNWDGSADFTNIQMAIEDNTTLENYTVYVYPGEYQENIIINKSIALVGQDATTTIIDANETLDGIRINADHVNVSGFTIKNSGLGSGYPEMDAGIDIQSGWNNISNCIFLNNTIGIYIKGALQNQFYGNEFQHCTNYGIYVYSNSDNTVIQNNIFTDNPNYCLRIKGSKYNQVIGNLFMNNKRGMYFCCGARENTVFHNSFVNNSGWHADDYVGRNQWSNTDLQEGNFWDDFYLEEHGAYDNNSDGIIDTPYVIDFDSQGKNIQDQYPLTEPYILHRTKIL